MTLSTQSYGTVAVVELSGRLDAHNAPDIASWIEQHSAQAVIDLHNVSFIDSTGLGMLVQGMKRCRQRGGDLHLCGLQEPVRIIFELTRLERAFALFADQDAAVNAFAA